VDGLYAWLDRPDPLPDIVLDIKPWKQYVRGAPGKNSIAILFEAMPACKQADIDDFLRRAAKAPPGGEVLYNLAAPCAFPEPYAPDQRADYVEALKEITESMPDKFELALELTRVEKQQGIGSGAVKQQLLLVRTLMTWAPLLPALLLLLIALLAVRSLKGLGRW
jgi:hypothetical protein